MLGRRLMRGTKEAQVGLHFLYHQVREGIPWRLGRSAGGRRRGSGPRLGQKGEVGRLSHVDWKERWARLDQNGPDEAGLVREERWTRLQESLGRNRFGPPEIEKHLEFLFSSFEFETKVKIQIKYNFKFKQVYILSKNRYLRPLKK
jgi:hypothetical protein